MRLEREAVSRDLYALLELTPEATPEDVRAAYRRQARASHPDLNPRDPDASRRMALLNLAARVLLSPELRGSYDRLRAARRERRSQRPSPARSWYEQTAGRGFDWVTPPTSARRTRSESAFAFGFRSWSTSAALSFTELMAAASDAQRALFVVVCLALGSSLIAAANPSNAFWTHGKENPVLVSIVRP